MNTFTRFVRSVVLPFAAAALIFGALFYFVFPTTTLLAQRADAAETEAEFERLTAEHEALHADIVRLNTPEEVERIAREDFNFVFPGEEAYALLPAPPAPVRLPTSWPFAIIHAQID